MAKAKAKAKAKEDRQERATPVDTRAHVRTMSDEAYLGAVRQALDAFGSNNSSGDINDSKDFWMHCRGQGISPEVCAATIYSGVRHRHEVARTVLREGATGASEAPVREQWEVVVKRGGVNVDEIVSAAGRRPDEVTAGNAVFAGFNDDEKAAAFSKKMTKAGYVSSFGPWREYTLHEDAGRKHWTKVIFYSEGAAQVFREAIERGSSYEANLLGQNVFTNAPHNVIVNTFDKTGVRGSVHREVEEAAETPKVDEKPAAEGALDWKKSRKYDGLYQATGKNGLYELIENGGGMWRVELDGSPVAAGGGYQTLEAAKRAAEGFDHQFKINEGSSGASEECDSCIPWQKVSRDANAAAQNTELAKKYGAIKNAQDVYRVVGAALNKENQEVFLVIPLDLRGELKAPPYEVARGQYSRVGVGVENVMAAVYHAQCEAFICTHNHPSGKATPSAADRHLTEEIRKACAPLGKGVTFVDHVVVGQKSAYSIVEKKMYKC
jgi:hypothetical protein